MEEALHICAEVSLGARLPELAVVGGVHEGTVWTVEISGKGWSIAEGPMDPKGRRALSVLGILCVELPTHHLGRKEGPQGGRRITGKTRVSRQDLAMRW